MTKKSKINYDIAILGAGVLGVSLAYHLRTSGLKVVVIEREAAPATHASGKNAGMMRQLYRNAQLTEWATKTIRSLPSALKDECFIETGSVIVGRTAPQHHSNLFVEQKTLTAKGEAPAVYTKSDGLIDSPNLVLGLSKAARGDGVEFMFNTAAISIAHSSKGWRIDTAEGQNIHTDLLVNAAGAWVNQPLQTMTQLNVLVQPFARHLFLVTGWPNNYMPSLDCGFFWDEAQNWYMRRWDTNIRLVSICDETPTQPETYIPASGILEQLSEKLLATLPTEIANNLRLGRSWHCFRTYTDDFLPIWGWDQLLPQLFWLSAFGGFGMSTGFAAAQDAAAEILGKKTNVSPEFSPQRVSVRPAKKAVAVG